MRRIKLYNYLTKRNMLWNDYFNDLTCSVNPKTLEGKICVQPYKNWRAPKSGIVVVAFVVIFGVCGLLAVALSWFIHEITEMKETNSFFKY